MKNNVVVEVKIDNENNRIIIEQMNKKIVDAFNFIVGTRDEHYNFACFQVLDKDNIRYFPFNNKKYLNYDISLPPITTKSCVLPTNDAINALNQLLGSKLWKPWGQDEEYIDMALGVE